MSAVILLVVVVGLALLSVEVLRWMFRPAAKRLRVIRKIGRR